MACYSEEEIADPVADEFAKGLEDWLRELAEAASGPEPTAEDSPR
jgi:hypothetical protein